MQTWRRQLCTNCGAIFTTIEAVDLTTSLMVEHTSHLEPFSRDILFISIHSSLGHREAAAADASGVTATVITKLRTRAKNSLLSTRAIAETAHEVLGHFDPVGAIQYGAYHKIKG